MLAARIFPTGWATLGHFLSTGVSVYDTDVCLEVGSLCPRLAEDAAGEMEASSSGHDVLAVNMDGLAAEDCGSVVVALGVVTPTRANLVTVPCDGESPRWPPTGCRFGARCATAPARWFARQARAIKPPR